MYENPTACSGTFDFKLMNNKGLLDLYARCPWFENLKEEIYSRMKEPEPKKSSYEIFHDGLDFLD